MATPAGHVVRASAVRLPRRPAPMPEFDPGGDLPAWAVAYASRVWFHVRQRRTRRARTRALLPLLACLRARTTEPGGTDRALHALLDACLELVAAAARTRPDLAPFRDELDTLCSMARAELAGACDDRALLARQYAWPPGMAGRAYAAGCVPGRAVFLAAVAARLPDEQGAAAVMLANDLAGVHRDLPLRALGMALG